MTLLNRKPSDFTEYPWDSVLQQSEAETIARNIMVILTRTGNTFRELSWEEYRVERLKDGSFREQEKHYFDMVIKYCKSEDIAIIFSKVWK